MEPLSAGTRAPSRERAMAESLARVSGLRAMKLERVLGLGKAMPMARASASLLSVRA